MKNLLIYLGIFIISTIILGILFVPSTAEETLNLLIGSTLLVLIIGLIHIIIFLLHFIIIKSKSIYKKTCTCKLLIGLNENEYHNITLYITENYLKFISSSGQNIFSIPYSDINNISFATDEILNEKEKSIIGRAIVGGLFFGVTGAVIGGLSGTGTKKNFEAVKILRFETNKGNFSAVFDKLSNVGEFMRNCKTMCLKNN